MKKIGNTSRILGVAFLLQFVTSISSGVFFNPALIVEGNISETMSRIANNPLLMRANILVDMLTALGIIFLGALLYLALRKQNEKIALVAMCFYILEAALLAISRMSAFSLLRISQEFATTGQPVYLLSMGNQALESMDFGGSTLHMLTFCFGGILFYSLLVKSKIVPRLLSLWGLLTVFPMLIATVSALFGTVLPMYFYILYMPFELVIGIWILIKGIQENPGIVASA
jgi:hypothetical protein